MLWSLPSAVQLLRSQCITGLAPQHSDLSLLLQVNLLSVVLNSAPILPEEDDEDMNILMKDSPSCLLFGLIIIWLSYIKFGTLFRIQIQGLPQ